MRVSIRIACGLFVAAGLACGDVPRAASPPSSDAQLIDTGRAVALDATAPLDSGAEALPPLPPQLEHRAVRAPGYSPGLAREWKTCVLDTMRDRDLRCGRELLWENEYLPKFRVSGACRALTSSVGQTCADAVTKAVNAALPSDADVAACRDTLDGNACADVAEHLANELFADHGGPACRSCGRDPKAFAFGANLPEPVPAPDALPFGQETLDAIYARVDAGLGALAARKCAEANSLDACSVLKLMADAHPTHPDHPSWQRTLAASRPAMDELWWAHADAQRCVRQRNESDETECANVRNYLEYFPKGRHANEARTALARSEPGRVARAHAAEIEDCKEACAAPPRDWQMSPGPANCTRILGRPCR